MNEKLHLASSNFLNLVKNALIEITEITEVIFKAKKLAV